MKLNQYRDQLSGTKENGQGNGGNIYPERRAFDRLLDPIVMRCMNTPVNQLDGQIEKILKEVAVFFGGDRLLLWELTEDGLQASLTHYYAEAGFEPPTKTYLQEVLPYIFDKVLALQNLCVSDTNDLSPTAHIDRQYLDQMGIRSFLIIPLMVGGDRMGALSLACIRDKCSWTNDDLFHFQRIGSILASVLDRQRSRRLIELRIHFETMLTDVSAAIIKSQLNEIDIEIERGLARVAEFFQCDSCGLMRVLRDRKFVNVTHGYYSDGIERVPLDMNLAALLPWCYERLIGEGNYLNIMRMADLPSEAEHDRRSFAELGVRSTLAIPLSVGDSVEHILTLGAMREERSWPEDYIPRLRLLGDMFANALARKQAEEELRKAYTEIAGLKNRLEAENIYLRTETSMSREVKSIIGRSDPIKYVHYRINQVAAMDTTVMIVGETGTGKGLVARAVHEGSLRKDKPMIHVNCAVLPANLIESELFGREKGAFTGAQAKQIGRFELADKGTIFLDEIAELPVELQAKLLRVVENGEFERLGDPHTVKVDIRIIASTNRNLEDEIRKGRFREDLFYRLSVFPITVPPLRERTEDIPLIVEALIKRLNKQLGRGISTIRQEVMRALQNYFWPGNVRELENVIERAVITSRGAVLQLTEQLGAVQPFTVAVPEVTPSGMVEMERLHIRKTLEALKWKIEGPNGAANTLGLKPSTLRTRMKRLNIHRPEIS
jgi:formate hydrogenlyase transcriptional activator